MSFQTQPAFVHYGGWDEKTRSHPCLKWMEQYTAAVDAKAWDKDPYSKWMTPEHTLQRSTGSTIYGGESSWEALGKEIYAPFSAHLHYPTFCIAWEIEGGWEMIGTATMYYNFDAPAQETRIKGDDGNEWDGAGPGAFHFLYATYDDGSIRLAESKIFADPSMAMMTMLRRGMMTAADLMG